MTIQDKLSYIQTFLELFKNTDYILEVEKVDDTHVLRVYDRQKKLVTNDLLVELFDSGTSQNLSLAKNIAFNGIEDAVQDTGSTLISDINAYLNKKYGIQVENQYLQNLIDANRRVINALIAMAVQRSSNFIANKILDKLGDWLTGAGMKNLLKKMVGFFLPINLLQTRVIEQKKCTVTFIERPTTKDGINSQVFLPAPIPSPAMLVPALAEVADVLVETAQLADRVVNTSLRIYDKVTRGNIVVTQDSGEKIANAIYNGAGQMSVADYADLKRAPKGNADYLKAVEEYKNMRREGA